jgi:predicted MPP superfamily phosphohydrolase
MASFGGRRWTRSSEDGRYVSRGAGLWEALLRLPAAGRLGVGRTEVRPYNFGGRSGIV